MIGVTCDPGLAVARGVWRKLRTGRSVRSATLLKSHRLFSEHYEHTAHLVDVATLYHTGQRSCQEHQAVGLGCGFHADIAAVISALHMPCPAHACLTMTWKASMLRPCW